MQDHGWSFQSHGLDHLIMTEIPPAQMRREIIESRRIIAEQLGQTVDFFCYPFAGFDESVEQAVRAAGYRGACGGPPFYENGPVSHYAIGRTEILEQDSFTQFRFKIRQGLGYYYFTLRQLGKVKRVFSKAW